MICQAVIVAGGKGERFGSNTPKQFLKLNSRPVLAWSIEAFSSLVDDLVVVLPEDQVDAWLKLTGTERDSANYIIAHGGSTRSESVLKGLHALPKKDDALIAVHDAARPLVRKDLISELFRNCKTHGSAVPMTGMRDSLRRVGQSGVSLPVDRDEIVAVQTPQIFKGSLLRAAYESSHYGSYTDDACLVEANGENIHLVPGDRWNIKITHPEDFKVAEILIIR